MSTALLVSMAFCSRPTQQGLPGLVFERVCPGLRWGLSQYLPGRQG